MRRIMMFLFDSDKSVSPVFDNEHGLGIITGLSGQWHFKSPFFLRIQANWIIPEGSFNTLSVLCGLGVEFETTPRQQEESPRSGMRHEIAFQFGQTTMNNYDERSSDAWGVEYRNRLGRYLEWTLSRGITM